MSETKYDNQYPVAEGLSVPALDVFISERDKDGDKVTINVNYEIILSFILLNTKPSAESWVLDTNYVQQ